MGRWGISMAHHGMGDCNSFNPQFSTGFPRPFLPAGPVVHGDCGKGVRFTFTGSEAHFIFGPRASQHTESMHTSSPSSPLFPGDPGFVSTGAASGELVRANRHLALLAEAASGLLRSAEPRAYVRQLYDSLSEPLGLAAYFNFLVDGGNGVPRLRLDSHAGVPEEVARGFEWLEYGSAVCGVVAEERRARVIGDVQRSADPLTELIRSLGITAYASYPLMADGELVGTLSFARRGRTSFDEDEVELLRVISDQVAVAIERAAGHEAERQARAAAERASEVKGQFLSSMTHDLRTPLTAIVGLAEVIQGGGAGPVTPEQRRHLGRINKAAWHLVAILDEILSFSRSEAGKLSVHRSDVDLNALADEVVEVLAGEAELKELELRVVAAAGPMVVHTDAGKVRQILTNLVGNAIRYTDAGRVEVAVEPAGGWVLCRVRDTGRGIAADSLDAIFEPFVQIDGNGSVSDGGIGLGLAVSRRLARLLGGDVEVESTPGEGSTFTVRLPA
jgi:signal transduction histidine kinase